MSTRRDLLMALPVLGAGWACLQPALGTSSASLAAVAEPARVQLAVAEPRAPESGAMRPGDARLRPASFERSGAEQLAAR